MIRLRTTKVVAKAKAKERVKVRVRVQILNELFNTQKR